MCLKTAETGVFYFAKPDNVDELKISSKADERDDKDGSVSICRFVRTESLSAYYKHYAFDGRMRRFSNEWFFELMPTYHFTEKWRVICIQMRQFFGRNQAHGKAPAVLGAFLTWKEILSDRKQLVYSL